MDNVEVREYIAVNIDELLALYGSVGWANYTNNPEMLENAFKNSLKVFAAYSRNKLIGIIRAVGDGFSIVYIQDVLVRPEFQRRGVASALMAKIGNSFPNVYQKVLLTDNGPSTLAFYERLGYRKSSDINCVALVNFAK